MNKHQWFVDTKFFPYTFCQNCLLSFKDLNQIVTAINIEHLNYLGLKIGALEVQPFANEFIKCRENSLYQDILDIKHIIE